MTFFLSLNKNIAKPSSRLRPCGPGFVVDVKGSAYVKPYLPVCINKTALAAQAKCHKVITLPLSRQSSPGYFLKPPEKRASQVRGIGLSSGEAGWTSWHHCSQGPRGSQSGKAGPWSETREGVGAEGVWDRGVRREQFSPTLAPLYYQGTIPAFAPSPTGSHTGTPHLTT